MTLFDRNPLSDPSGLEVLFGSIALVCIDTTHTNLYIACKRMAIYGPTKWLKRICFSFFFFFVDYSLSGQSIVVENFYQGEFTWGATESRCWEVHSSAYRGLKVVLKNCHAKSWQMFFSSASLFTVLS